MIRFIRRARPVRCRGSSRFWPLAVALLAAAAPGRAETLTLADCLRETAEHNPSIIAQRMSIEQAGGRRLVFRSRALPKLGISGLLGQQGAQDSQVLRIPAVRDASGKITQPATQSTSLRSATFLLIGSEGLSQPIFDAAIPASWRRGNVEMAVAKANFAVVASAELHAARTLFDNALFAQENGAILRGLSNSLNGNVQVEQQLLGAGLVGRQGLLAAQVQAANLSPAILEATGGYRKTLTQLLQTMGRSLGATAAGADPVASVTLAGSLGGDHFTFDGPEMSRLAMARRPDLAAMREAMDALNEDANIARGGYYPVISLFVTGDLLPQSVVRSNVPNAVRAGDNTRASEVRPGVREEWTVIDTGQVRGQVRQAESLRDAVAISLHSAERNIPGELALVRAQLTSAENQSDLLAGNMSTAADTLDLVKSAISQGTSSQLEYLDAETGVLSARTGLLAARLQVSLARAEFDRVTGGYLRYVSDDPSVLRAASK